MAKAIINNKIQAREVRKFLEVKCASNVEYSHVTCGWEFGKFIIRDEARDVFLPELATKLS